MAYEVINTFNIYDFQQDEVIDIQQVANPDTGVVEEVAKLVQEDVHVWVDLIVKQERIAEENKSNFRCELWANVSRENATMGEGIIELYFPYPSQYQDPLYYNYVKCGNYYAGYTTSNSTEFDNINALSAEVGETNSQLIGIFDTTNTVDYFSTYHDANGDFTNFNVMSIVGSASGRGHRLSYSVMNFILCTKLEFNIASSTFGLLEKVAETKGDLMPTPLAIDRALHPTTAMNFTDEENPTFNYPIPASGRSCLKEAYNAGISDYVQLTEKDRVYDNKVVSLETALSFDGITIDIPYRNIELNGGTYTFYLTEEERELLRQKAQGSDTVPIYYLIKIGREIPTSFSVSSGSYVVNTTKTEYAVSATKRNLTIIGCNPQLNPTVKDIKLETLALTGDENTFIRYESMAEYAINATASKGATIVSQSVTCGSKTISNLPNGVIDDVESGTFIFNVTDSRSMGASSSVFKNLVEYVKPTCYQKEEIEITGETGANIKITVNGSYYNGSFGAADNTLLLEVRHTDGNDNWGEWKTLNGTPTYNGTTYQLEAMLTGFNYGKAYIFQCRATDKLNVVQSSQYTVRMLPVFDWSETDFNFNVPVNIDAEDLNMHGETIIRHSDSTNNTVLSAAGGHIYLRPGGTNDTSGETIFYGNGNVKFNGTVTFADGSTGGGDPLGALGDYVIEAGSSAMGSNGTWYWRKWANGTAEAWGCRNFGNMAITTAWGNLYRSAVFTQDLPNNVFIRTPDAININIVHSNFGGWICKHEQTAPSADTTGSFIFVRPASATATPTNIGFYVVGEWK